MVSVQPLNMTSDYGTIIANMEAIADLSNPMITVLLPSINAYVSLFHSSARNSMKDVLNTLD